MVVVEDINVKGHKELTRAGADGGFGWFRNVGRWSGCLGRRTELILLWDDCWRGVQDLVSVNGTWQKAVEFRSRDPKARESEV